MKCHIQKHANPELAGKSIYLVVRDSDAYVMGQHSTRVKAERHLRKLEPPVKNPTSLSEIGF